MWKEKLYVTGEKFTEIMIRIMSFLIYIFRNKILKIGIWIFLIAIIIIIFTKTNSENQISWICVISSTIHTCEHPPFWWLMST